MRVLADLGSEGDGHYVAITRGACTLELPMPHVCMHAQCVGSNACLACDFVCACTSALHVRMHTYLACDCMHACMSCTYVRRHALPATVCMHASIGVACLPCWSRDQDEWVCRVGTKAAAAQPEQPSLVSLVRTAPAHTTPLYMLPHTVRRRRQRRPPQTVPPSAAAPMAHGGRPVIETGGWGGVLLRWAG